MRLGVVPNGWCTQSETWCGPRILDTDMGSGVPKSRRINLRAGQVPWSCHHSPLRLAGIFAAIHTFTTSSSTGHSSRLSGVKAVLMSRLRLPFFPGVL